MLAPQAVDPLDAMIMFEGKDVISELGEGVVDPTDPNYGKYQKEIGAELGHSTMNVTVNIVDMTVLTTPVVTVFPSLTMSFISQTNTWYISLSELDLSSFIGHKVYGSVESSDYSMRTFTILEFIVDDRMLEKTLATMGYQITDIGSGLQFVWTDNTGTPVYKADAYKNGSGTNHATNPAEVTHRGPVTRI